MLRVLFMGRKPVAADALAWLVRQQGVDVVGVLTDNHLEISPTSEIANSCQIPLLDFGLLNHALEKDEFQYDLGLSMLYWRKLGAPFIRGARLGNINFHPAPLPDYKGTAGYNLAILENKATWGATAHYMDEGIDTGGIINVQSFPIDQQQETALSLERKTRPVLLQLFKSTVTDALGAPAALPTTPNEGGRYICRKEMEDMKRIVRGDDVGRKIRAFWFPPYDGAFIEMDGERFTLIDRPILDSLADPANSSLFTKPSSD